MGNELAKALKRKTDAQFRVTGEDYTPSIVERADGVIVYNDPGETISPYVAGKNVLFGTSGNNRVINAIMNVVAGTNVKISPPDPITGAVSVSANIGGKSIDLTGMLDGYLLTYDSTTDAFIFAPPESSYVLPQATDIVLGGVMPKLKTSETSEVAIDPITGKLYSNAPSEAVNGLPMGGVGGQLLSKFGETDYQTQWMDMPSGLPGGGAAGQVLSKIDGVSGNVEWINPPTGEHPTYGTILKAQDIFNLLFGTIQKSIVLNVNVSPDIIDSLFVTCPYSGNSTSQFTFNSTGGNFNIWFAYQTEFAYDFIAFWIDDILLGEYTGTNMNNYLTKTLTPGLHTFKVRYRQDGSVTGGWGGCRIYAISYL